MAHNLSDWKRNKKPILRKFTSMPDPENPGGTVLAQGRVLRDWDKLEKKRQELEKYRRKGGSTCSEQTPSTNLSSNRDCESAGNEKKRNMREVREEQDETVDKNALDSLCADLYPVADKPFSGKHREALKGLLKKYSAAEILAAYRRHVSTLDGFELKFAPKTFSEGGAEAIIEWIRRYIAEQERTKLMIQKAEERLAQEAAEESAKKAEEDKFVEF
jgi:hypothetical protein